jgi:hypothetical protein
MKFNMIFSLLFVFLFQSTSSAALLSGAFADKQVDYTYQNSSGKISLVGKGLRKKKILFVNVQVYNIALYALNNDTLVKTLDGAQASFAQQPVVALKMQFLRDLDVEKIAISFKEAFEANSIDANLPHMKEFLEKTMTSGNIKNGQTVTLLLLKTGNDKENQEQLIFESASGAISTVQGPAGFIKDILSIWLGNSKEDAMIDLKKQLLAMP